MWPFSTTNTQQQTGSAYDYSFTTLVDNAPMPLLQFKGKVLLIVNTASQCGFTKQYASLQALYTKYKDRQLVVIGVPSNDFGRQEPGSAEQIRAFCQLNYNLSFPMTAKTVVCGNNQHAFYRWARATLGWGTAPKWNFHKYLIDSQGKLVGYFNSTTAPDSPKIINAVTALLPK